MFRPLECFIGLRYTRAKRRNHFISFISVISILGIALGVMTLITVISVMNGFELELRTRILSMASHATIARYADSLDNWQMVAGTAEEHPDVVAAAPYIEGEVMLSNGRRVSGAILRGVVPAREEKVADIADKMLAGRLSDLAPGEFDIALGSELAALMDVKVGDTVTVITPQATATPVGVLPRLKRFTVSGIFEIGMYEYDRSLAFIHIDDASRLLRMGDGVTGVRLKLNDMFKARQVVADLNERFGDNYWVSDWTRQHANFFSAIQTERRVMFIILTLILTVAAFNLVSTLVMVVTDKQSDIAVLRTLGMTPMGIMKVFMVQGVLIGLVGAVAGVIGGVILALNVERIVAFLEHLLQVQFLSPDVYYISKLPSQLYWGDVALIGCVAFVLSVIATLYPAWRASRIQPAEALRYE
ncbi:MAG: lipoprotein-releasing ABC transporter permease subunit [Gammaproteobacteria bacterium]|nr:lipoprotein-releasing ABC transporter permease subunit [Gammaproteobacteria bacterium]